MLVIEVANISELREISDYHVGVRVNDKILWTGYVRGFRRAEGWVALVERVTEAIQNEPKIRGEYR